MSFSKEQIRQRRLYRLAQVIRDHWEEGSGMDTRYFDHPYMNNEYVIRGKTAQNGDYREHAVPRVYLRDQCLELYAKGASVDQVTQALSENLRIVLVSVSEAELLNKSHKMTMPEGWKLGEGDPLARFHAVGIEVID